MLSVSFFFFFLTVSKQSSLTSTFGPSSQKHQKVPETQEETIQEALPSGSQHHVSWGSDARLPRNLHYPYHQGSLYISLLRISHFLSSIY